MKRDMLCILHVALCVEFRRGRQAACRAAVSSCLLILLNIACPVHQSTRHRQVACLVLHVPAYLLLVTYSMSTAHHLRRVKRTSCSLLHVLGTALQN